MNRTRIVMQAFLLGSSLLAFLSPVDAQDASYPLVTDTSWTVKDGNGNVLGFAQQVCLATNSPSNCPGPANATLFNPGSSNIIWPTIPGFPGANRIWSPMTAWTFALSSVANASGGNTVYTGTITSGGSNAFKGYNFTIAGFTNLANNGTFLCVASTATTLTLANTGGVAETHAATATAASQSIKGGTIPSDNAEFFFSRPFYICGPPQPGTISLSADDSAEVFLNGATTPVVTSTNWSVVTTASVPVASAANPTGLIQGQNFITIHAKNAAIDCNPDTYACNPAGVALGASFTDTLPAVPQCTNPTKDAGTIIQVPAAQGCTATEICACVFGNAFWLTLGTSCPPGFTIGGTISGLTGSGLTLQDNGGNNLTVPAGATSFTFPGTVPAQGFYDVTVLTQPSNPASNCTVANGSGTANGNVTNIAITCTCINGLVDTEACPSPQIGTQTRTCANGIWGSFDTSKCVTPVTSCPPGQLLCFNGATKLNQCYPTSGITDVNRVFHSWCGNADLQIYCNNSCPAGVTCAPANDPVNHLATTDEYCGDGNITKIGGGSDVALVTFLGLIAVWSIAGLWRLRRGPSR